MYDQKIFRPNDGMISKVVLNPLWILNVSQTCCGNLSQMLRYLTSILTLTSRGATGLVMGITTDTRLITWGPCMLLANCCCTNHPMQKWPWYSRCLFCEVWEITVFFYCKNTAWWSQNTCCLCRPAARTQGLPQHFILMVLSTSTLTLITAPVNRLAFTMTDPSQPRPNKTWDKDLSATHIHQHPGASGSYSITQLSYSQTWKYGC